MITEIKDCIERYNKVSKAISDFYYVLSADEPVDQEQYVESLTSYYILVGQLEVLTELLIELAHLKEVEIDFEYELNHDTGIEYSLALLKENI